MDNTTLGIGIAALIVSVGIIILSFKMNSEVQETPNRKQIDQLKVDIKSVIENFSEFGDDYFRNQKSDIQKEAIRLKIECERIIGISAISKINISTYERPNNHFGLDQIKTDLTSLSRQLSNL